MVAMLAACAADSPDDFPNDAFPPSVPIEQITRGLEVLDTYGCADEELPRIGEGEAGRLLRSLWGVQIGRVQQVDIDRLGAVGLIEPKRALLDGENLYFGDDGESVAAVVIDDDSSDLGGTFLIPVELLDC
jgi:hypothetical protein